MQLNQQLLLLQQQLQVPVGKVNLILPQACQKFIKKYEKNINIDIKTMNQDVRLIMQQIDIYAQYTYDVITKYKCLDKLGVIVRSVVEGQNMILGFLANISMEYIREKSLYEKKVETLTHRVYQKCQNCQRSLENAHIMAAQDQVGLKFRDPLQYFMHDLEQINKLSEEASLIFRKKMLHVEGIEQEQYMRRLQKMYQNVTNTIQNVTSSLNNLTCFQEKFSQFQQVQYMSTRGQKQRIQKNRFDQKKFTLDLSKHFYGKMKRLEDRLTKIRSFFISLANHQTQTQNQFNQCTPEALAELRQKNSKIELQKKQIQLYISSMQQQVIDGKLKIKTSSQNYSILKAQKDKCEQRIKNLELELDLIKQKQERNMMILRLSQKANENIVEEKQLKIKGQSGNQLKPSRFSSKKKNSQNEQTLKESMEKRNKQSSEQKNISNAINKQGDKNQYITKRQSKLKKQSQRNLFGQKQINGKINTSRLSKIIKEVQKQKAAEMSQNGQNTSDLRKRKQKPKIKILQKKSKTLIQQKINENEAITHEEDPQRSKMIQSLIENTLLQNLNEQPEQKQEDNESMSNYGQFQQEQFQQEFDSSYLTINPMYQICVISSEIKLCQVNNINKENLVVSLNILAKQQAKLKIQKQQCQTYEQITKNIYNKLVLSKYISKNEITYQKFKSNFDEFIKDVQCRDKKQEENLINSLSKITEGNSKKNRTIKDQFKLEFNELQTNMKKRNLLTITPKIRQEHKRATKNLEDGCSQSEHTEILKQKNEERQKYKGMLLKSKNKSKIYTENNYDEQKMKTGDRKQGKNVEESTSPYSLNLNLRKIQQMKGKLINNENYQSFSKNNSTLPSPKYMSLSKFHNQKYDLLSTTENLFSTLNSKSYLQNLPHLKKKNREKSLNINLDKVSLEQQIQFPLISNQQLTFTVHDVKIIYHSVENALEINQFSQKHRKTLSHISTQENPLYPLELNYMKHFFTKLANVHLKNKAGYQKIREFLLCPYDSAISQTTELSVGKLSGHYGLNSNMMRQALRSIILMHRSCNVREELCRHLKYLLGKIVSFEANH